MPLSQFFNSLAPTKITGSFLSTKTFLYDPFFTLGDWLVTNGAEVEIRRLDPPALGVVDITCKQAPSGPGFYYGGILQYVDLEGVNKIRFTAKKDVSWRSVLGVECLVSTPKGFDSVYTKYQDLKEDYNSWEIDDIGVTDPIDAIWITCSYNVDTRVSLDSILIEA